MEIVWSRGGLVVALGKERTGREQTDVSPSSRAGSACGGNLEIAGTTMQYKATNLMDQGHGGSPILLKSWLGRRRAREGGHVCLCSGRLFLFECALVVSMLQAARTMIKHTGTRRIEPDNNSPSKRVGSAHIPYRCHVTSSLKQEPPRHRLIGGPGVAIAEVANQFGDR